MNWFQRLLKTVRMGRELDAELRFHFEKLVADKIQAGMSEAEALRAARLEFGGIVQVKEECRESRGTLWLLSILQDLRFGARILARSPGFAVTAIVVLALGIGVGTLAFSLYNIVSLQTIPVRDAATVVRVERRSPENITPGVPYASIAYYRDNAKSLSAVMATLGSAPLVLNQDEQRVQATFVSSNYFSELGGSAAAGRLFDAARDDSASAPVCILSYRLWQRKFEGDPSWWKASDGHRRCRRGVREPGYGRSRPLAPSFAALLLCAGQQGAHRCEFRWDDRDVGALGSRRQQAECGTGTVFADQPVAEDLPHCDLGE